MYLLSLLDDCAEDEVGVATVMIFPRFPLAEEELLLPWAEGMMMEVLGCVTVVVVTVVVEARTTGTVIDFWRMLGATDCPVLETRITWKNKMIFNLSMSAEAPYNFNNTSVTIAFFLNILMEKWSEPNPHLFYNCFMAYFKSIFKST